MPTHAHHPIAGVIVLILFVAGFFSAFLAAADFSALKRDIAQALIDALRDTGFTQKEIYMPMRMSKGMFSRILAGEKSLSLVRLQLAPFAFNVAVWKRLIANKAQDFATELREDAKTVRQVAERSRVA